MAVAQCTLIMELIMGAVWFGLWAGYDMAENCDKDLRLWYALMLGGIVFGLICQVGLIIETKKESKPALKLCNVLIKLDHLFEFGVHLWGVDLAYGKKSARVDAGGCKVLATWQKVNATTILVLASLAMCAIMTGGGEDAEKSTEQYIATEMRSPAMRKHTEMKRMRDSQV